MKKFLKSYCVGFIISVLLCGSVYAATYFASNDVTYDNTVSGLSSTDVQGAIDELYTECTKEPTAGETIIENAGLEKDPYECRYFFTGANPNNYITFNDEKAGWRIISVECDGTIKITKTIEASVNPHYDFWDYSTNSNNWARPADLNTYLNETYLNSLNSKSKTQIIAHNFSIGSVAIENNDLEGQINDENSKVWKGKIALPTLSEYLRTNSNTNCKSFNSYDNNYSTCKNTNWMYNSSYNTRWWMLSPRAGTSESVFYIDDGFFYDAGSIGSSYADGGGFPDYAVRPTFYLNSDITLSGTGTSSDPYQISL